MRIGDTVAVARRRRTPIVPHRDGAARGGGGTEARERRGPATPCGVAGPGAAAADDQAWTASSSSATFFVRFGSTWMPGPIVVETVTFLM